MLLSHWSIAPFRVDEAFSTLLGRGSPPCLPERLRTPRPLLPDNLTKAPVRFFGQTRGLPLRLDASLSPLPLFSDEKRRFVLPKLHFRCISNTLQSYEKILKLTNYKHKTFKKLFVGAAILLCIKQLQKFKSKILITNDLCRLSTSFNCTISCLF